MKKLISVVAATAVTMSVFSSLASAAPFYEEGFEGELNEFNVPAVDYVPVGLSVGLTWDGGESYRSALTKTIAYSATATTADTTFDARAELDMGNVAKEWEAILKKASNEDAARRAAAIDNAKLTGEFTLTIEDTSSTAKDIDNTDVKALSKDALKWINDAKGYNVEKFFEFKSMVKDGDQYVITMALKNYDGINKDLDEYFTALAAADRSSDYALLLDIEDSNVPAPSSAGTYRYQVTGTFGGYVDIALGQNKVSKIWFGTGNTAESGENVAVADSADITVTKARRSGGGGGGGTTTSNATPAPVETSAPTETSAPIETSAPSERPTPVANPQTSGNANGATLNYDDHFAYIIGYNLEEGETLAQVRPQANITRAEVATIFFRLLTDESRTKFWTKTNSFNDVPAEEWYNNAISTDAKAGIMEGSDGRFRPNAPITRAEFATIASRFSSVTYTGEDKFSDISGHWAAEYINKAAETGWINGYDDGTFKPNAYITRAEAMTLINRMVYRIVDNHSLVEAGMNKWSDNLDTAAWFYADVQEATNSHDYERTAIGYVETWTANKAPRDWEALEKTWSEAASAGAEESVFSDSGLEELNTENTK